MTTLTAARRVSTGKRTGGWVLAGAQGGYAVWFAICALVALPVYHAGNDLEGLWPWLMLLMTVQIGPLLAGLSLVASGWLLVFGYASGRRPLILALLGSSLAVLVTLAASLSPVGLSVSGWLLH
jgi:hypothetical protein